MIYFSLMACERVKKVARGICTAPVKIVNNYVDIWRETITMEECALALKKEGVINESQHQDIRDRITQDNLAAHLRFVKLFIIAKYGPLIVSSAIISTGTLEPFLAGVAFFGSGAVGWGLFTRAVCQKRDCFEKSARMLNNLWHPVESSKDF